MQDTIGQRVKFLLEHFKLSARKFSREIGVAENNTQNYLPPSNREPGARYLELVLLRFESINPTWLLTGQGEPFLPPTNENDLVNTTNQKFFRSPIIGHNQGTANQQQNISPNTELDSFKNKLALAEKEIEHLRAQLESKDTVIAAKDETISLLRASYNRPN